MENLGINPMKEDAYPLPKRNAEKHPAFMDEAGIDYSLLSAPVSHIYNGDVEKARTAARRIIEEVASWRRTVGSRKRKPRLVHRRSEDRKVRRNT